MNNARVRLHNTTIEDNEAVSRAFFKDGQIMQQQPCFIETPFWLLWCADVLRRWYFRARQERRDDEPNDAATQ